MVCAEPGLSKRMAPTVLLGCSQQKQKDSKRVPEEYLVATMSKTQKFSGGGQLVSKNRLVVDSGAVQEGLRSSTWSDAEMMASEDSSFRNRKSSHFDIFDDFDIPIRVLPVSKMSSSDREGLEMKLRAELEQIRILQKKISDILMDGSDIGNVDIETNNALMRPVNQPVSNNFNRKSLELSTGQKKKRPLSRRSGGSHSKKRNLGSLGTMNQVASRPSRPSVIKTVPIPMLMKQCEALLKKLMSHQHGWAFNTPVDVVQLNIPDYFTVIKQPMDLGTVKSKIESAAYSSPIGFRDDVRLTFSNAMTYNPPRNDFHVMAAILSKFFEMRWKAIEKRLALADSEPMLDNVAMFREAEADQALVELNKWNLPAADSIVYRQGIIQVMTDVEKRRLKEELEALAGDMPESVIDYLSKNSQVHMNESEMEIDLETLGHDTLLTLRSLLDDHMQQRIEKVDGQPMNESGLTNHSTQPCNGDDPCQDEDIDICENNSPLPIYVPVEIEKDVAVRDSKCSSLSNSSSDLSSSSSDSEADSSSSSKSAAAKTATSVGTIKDTAALVEALDHERSDLVDPHEKNASADDVDQDVQSQPSRLMSTEAESSQDGKNGRQVSPDKLYRAALLRIRFADTILRAREKTLDKGEKADPEKMRQEREKLEKQQREERARLEAEAKAVENARRQAEEEAAKRKLEIEREAARQALQKMEKTVEINECPFLKDLEMLGTAPAEHLTSLIGETGSDHLQGEIDGFKVGGINPLEQLGLYMKVEDEEEEACELQNNSVVNDAEEGEID